LNETLSDAMQARSAGVAARQVGEREEALRRFREAARLDPENIWIKLDLALEWLESGRPDEAAPLYREVAEERPDLAAAWRGLGMAARARGDRVEALAHFRAAAALAPDHDWTSRDLAGELIEAGRLDEAAAIYRGLIEKNPEFDVDWRALGHVARARGDHGQALSCYRQAARLNPDHPWSRRDVAIELRALAAAARQAGDRDAALEHFREALALDGGDVATLRAMAAMLEERGRREEAEQAFRELTARAPEIAEGWRSLGRLARQRGAREEAAEHFRAAVRLDPENVWTMQDLVLELRDLGRFDEAEEIARAFVERRPGSAQAIVMLANLVRRRATAGEMIALFEKAAAAEPGNPHVRLALAGEYLSQWRLDDAEALYDLALTEDGRNAAALRGKAQAASRRGDRASALHYFEAAAGGADASPWTIVEFARELAEADRLDQARAVLRAAADRDPREPIYDLHLGFFERAIGNRNEARAAFLRATGRDPNMDRAQIELAVEDFAQGRASEAIESLRRLAEGKPEAAAAKEKLAEILHQLDELPQAIELQREALAIDPSNIWSHLKLAHGLARLGMRAEAEAILVNCQLRFGAAPEIEAARARVLTDRGDYGAARALLESAAARFPGHLDLWILLVTALIDAGEFARARETIEARRPGAARDEAKRWLLRGLLAAAEWDLERSHAFFADALKLDPADQSAAWAAARVALLGANVEAAQAYLNRFLVDNPSHRSFHRGAVRPSQTHLGQMLDEFNLDRVNLRAVQAALKTDDPVSALARIVLDAPDYTPAAICYLIALRRQGRLAPGPAQGGAPSPIPRRIVQFWDENIPPDIATLCAGWREAHPSFAYRLFSSEEARAYLASMGARAVLAAFDRAVEPAMKADIFRLAFLGREGGFYIDADDRCLAPLTTLNVADRSLVSYQEDYGTVGNNFIAASPGHPVIERALAHAVEAINRGDADVVWLSTGPGLLTREVASYLAADPERRLDELFIFDRHQIHEHVAIHCATAYKNTGKHWSRTSFARNSPVEKNVVDPG
jgi:tetratricopeptide (TPR) repeat protein